MWFEHRSEPLLPRRAFIGRVAGSLLLAAAVVSASLVIGTLGYHGFARLPWIDAFQNAAMILTGMGPVDVLPDDASKLFASVYALTSGLVELTVTALLLGPVLHRVLHRFHLEADGDG